MEFKALAILIELEKKVIDEEPIVIKLLVTKEEFDTSTEVSTEVSIEVSIEVSVEEFDLFMACSSKLVVKEVFITIIDLFLGSHLFMTVS
jgi:hypothetical protein